MSLKHLSQAQAERRAGILLIASAALAVILANSGFADIYHHALDAKFGPPMPRIGQMTVHYWIADGLMAIFFLLVGLEVKREWYEGRLSTPSERRLPIIAAVAGMAVPAAIYLLVVGDIPGASKGWAIPAATDIAFAVGVLAILGRHAPSSIKLLLVTIAIVDDIGAVAIIALFYTADINVMMLAGAIGVIGAMAVMGQFGVRNVWPFMVGFAVAWFLMLGSGVHATIAGVLAALTIPLGRGESRSPLKRLEHDLHPWVMFLIVPLFGLASAGVDLGGGVGALTAPISLGIMLGLFLGKQLGVFGAIWLAVKAGVAPKPEFTSWRQIHGAAVLCGIGFTMSLFIGDLAFPGHPELVAEAKIGILAGSLLSAIAGYLALRTSPIIECDDEEQDEAFEIFGADQPDDDN